MTESRQPARKSRAERAKRSTEAQRTFWEERFAAVESPLDLVQENWALLRTRLVQLERKALVRVERANTPEKRVAAAEKLAEARTQIETACATAATELARLVDQIKTERR